MVAVQALDPVPKTGREYYETYKQKPRLPSNPSQYYGKEDWERIGKWRGFLGQDIPEEKYSTIQEAAKAAQALYPVPKTREKYQQTYKQNSRLPSNPSQYYGKEAWERIGKWRGFLGQDIPEEKYPTIEEAAKAAQALYPVPKTREEYQQTYKQKSRLPCNPSECYGKEAWERIRRWKGFLGTAKYPTVEESAIAVQALDPVPKTEQEYQQTYKQNSRLPSSPDQYYGKRAWECIGTWKGFLGTGIYPTIEEAAIAVQALDPVPKTMPEYRQTYKQNSRLPSYPRRYYGIEAWERVGRLKGFLGKK